MKTSLIDLSLSTRTKPEISHLLPFHQILHVWKYISKTMFEGSASGVLERENLLADRSNVRLRYESNAQY